MAEDKAIQMMRERAKEAGYSEEGEEKQEAAKGEQEKQEPQPPKEDTTSQKETPQGEPQEKKEEESSLNTEDKTQEDKGEEKKPEPLVKELSEETKQEQQESAPSGEQSVDDDVVEVESDADMARFISNHYGKDFTEDQIKSLVNGENVTSEAEYANDTVKEINEYVKGGGSIEDYYNFKLTDFGSYSQAEQIAWKVKRDNPELTDNEVNRLVNKKYQFNVDKDDLTEDEIQDLEIERKMAASSASKEFEQLQQKYSTPFQSKNESQESNQKESSQPEFTEEEVKAFQDAMESSVNNLSEVRVGNYSYAVNDDLRSKVKEMPLDIGDIFVENGEFNHDKYNQFRAIAADPEAYSKAMVEHGKSQALKEIKDRRNNVSLEPEPQNPDNQNLQNPQESFRKLREAQSGGGSGMRMKF